MSTAERIGIDQIRVGLYISLENWTAHPFLFNSFKIRNEKQLEILRSLGIQHVLYVREKSDFPPLLPQLEADDDVEEGQTAASAPSPEVISMWQAKQARREKMAQQREALGRAEKKFQGGMATVKTLLRNLFATPEAAIQQAHGLVSEMVDSLLAEKDVVLHLMNAKSGDENAYYHALNVTMLALMLGKEARFNAAEMRVLGLGCLLHDMGKEKVPSQILLKKTPWTLAERNFYQQHVLYGVEMMQQLARQLPEGSAGAMEVVAMHHEFLDGSGFPGRLTAERIGRYARVACIANAFDNYCNRQNMAESMSPAEAISFMFRREKDKYDAELMQLFVRSMGVYPPGSLVQLNNGVIGLVMNVNPQHLLHPALLIYEPGVPKEEALWMDLSDDPELSVVKTLRPADLPQEIFEYLEPRSRVSYYAGNNVSTNRTQ